MSFIKKYICELLFFSFFSFVAFLRFRITGSFYEKLLWDEGWYSTIIDYGYMYNGDNGILHNVPFFPLYPLICKALKFLIPALHTNLAMLLIANIFAYLTIKLLFILTKELFNYRIAAFTIAFFLSLPFSFFIFLGFTESLFFTLILSFFYFYSIKRMRFVPLIIIALASLTRIYGILLLVVYLIDLFYQKDKEALRNDILLAPIGTIGLSLFCLYFYWIFDHPFLFLANQIAWGHHSTNDILNLFKFKGLVVSAFEFDLSDSQSIAGVYFILSLFLSVGIYKVLPRSFFTYYIVFFLFLFYILSPISNSIARYLICLFPVIISVPLALLSDLGEEFQISDFRFLIFCFFLLGLNLRLLQIFFEGIHFVG